MKGRGGGTEEETGMFAAMVVWAVGVALGAAPASAPADLAAMPANTWVLLDEVGGRGKEFAALVAAEGTQRLYLWGFGGKMLSRSRFERYELEIFMPADCKWADALPAGKAHEWWGGNWPPFRLYGYEGTDGPRIRSIGSEQAPRVEMAEVEGVLRPSPVAIFNQCCYDSKRWRILFFAGGKTFALDERTQTWSDLKPAAGPTACGTLAWASLCYDPKRDLVLLFGGGAACNLDGGARTWLYDCSANTWRQPKLDAAPPLRCLAPIVYDPKADRMVMFGGFDQRACLNDTWVFDGSAERWEQRRPAPSPPPMYAPAAAALPGGGVLVCGANALKYDHNRSAGDAAKETWVYDTAADTWRAIAQVLDLPNCRWLTAAGGVRRGVVFLAAFPHDNRTDDPVRRTYALRYDPAAPAAKRDGAPPGTVRWKFADQRDSLAAGAAAATTGAGPAATATTRPRTAEQAERFFRDLPANQVIDAAPPGLLVSKTWSSATFDSDRGEVIYTGGGHSGYSGNDWAHYSLAANRWSLGEPPCFPPFLEGTNGSVFGWSYGCRPWSQHTYRWYAYDPLSKRVIYCARPAGLEAGHEVLLEEDPAKALVYDPKRDGLFCWVYDPAARKLARPSLHRPFGQTWSLALVSTPQGVFARPGGGDRRLFRAAVRDEQVSWQVVDDTCPPAGKDFNYEYQPLVYDSKRQRLLLVMGKDQDVEVHARDLARPGWTKLPTAGACELSREVVYSARADALLSLGKARLDALDLASGRWRELDVQMPKGAYATECAMIYDPARDVCVLLIPRGFSAAMGTYLFRYDPATAKWKADP
jgi:hypothetical protein